MFSFEYVSDSRKAGFRVKHSTREYLHFFIVADLPDMFFGGLARRS